MGFSGYFLIVADFMSYSRRNDIPVCPGRGSAAGSLVAYRLTITNIDPIKYSLIFERFLNTGRISMPDIDIDFCLQAQEIVSLETIRQQSIRAIEVDLPEECVSRDTLESLRDVFDRYHGECRVLFRVSTDNGKSYLVSANAHYRVFPCDEMIEEIETITGRKVTCTHGNEGTNAGEPAGVQLLSPSG